MPKFTFIVTAEAPEGVTQSEVADHLADASRAACWLYRPEDPLSRMPPIAVYGSIPKAELPSSSAPACAEVRPHALHN